VVKNNEPLPLWMEAIPDREPWRRGRVAIATISAVVLVALALGLIAALLRGDIAAFFAWAVSGGFACLLLFLIWIGQNWARWIVAPFFGIIGFAALVRAITHLNGEFFYVGRLFAGALGALMMFAYLALSPAVYAFARRQREHASVLESVGIGAGFLLVLATIGSALLAFHNYQNTLEDEASEFAQLTFHRVFENRDARFLESHASATRKTSRPAQFIHMAEDQLGTVQSVGPFGGRFTARLEGKRIVLNGRLQTRAIFETGGCWVHIAVSGSEGDWAIDHISWNY